MTTAQIRKESQELEQSFTPSLARRLSRQFIEQTRQPIPPRSPSVPRDSNRHYQSPTRESLGLIGSSELAKRLSTSAASDQIAYRDRSFDRGIRRANSLLEASKYDRSERHSPRRSISLFDDDDDDDDRLLPPLPRHIMTLGRKYKESTRSNAIGNARRENFHGYRTDKIQEEPGDLDTYPGEDCKEDVDNNVMENGSVSESTSISACNSNANLMDMTISSVSARSCETSPTESSSNLGDYNKSISKSFENRLLAAENLIKESKLKNLTPRFNPNLSCNYKDTDKCDKEALITSDYPSLANTSKRRSCIPSLRLRSGSLTREPSVSTDRRKSFAGSQDASANQERSILSKFFRSGKETEPKDNDKNQKPKQHRISRFLRPDFFDTPREESQYVKEKEAQKAAENERRKSRFMRRKSESKERKEEVGTDEKICKEQKNEMNALQKDKLDGINASSTEDKSKSEDREKIKVARQGSKSGFLHSLEKKLERLRSNDESTTSTTITKPTTNGNVPGDRKERGARECSAPPVECLAAKSSFTEMKRTLSVEDLPLNESTKSASSAKGRVTSVLGLFRTNTDTKQNANGRSQSAIMSKLKRSPPKSAKSTSESTLEEDANATSKIPTKFTRADNKPVKKMPEIKKSPPKEKPKEREPIVKERRPVEKQSREYKRAPEKLAQLDSSSFADKTKQEKTELLRKLSDDSESLQRTMDNKQTESNNEDKRLKIKKSSLDKNGSVNPRIDKSADVDKKIKKPVILKEETDKDKDEINGTKKKKIVHVVRKVVKKSSDNSESKSDEKEKSRLLMKKKIVTTKKEKNPEGPTGTMQNSIKGNNVDGQTAARSKQTQPSVQESSSAKANDADPPMQTIVKADDVEIHTVSNSSDVNVPIADLSQTNSAVQNASGSQNYSSPVVQSASNSMQVSSSASSIGQNASSFVSQAKPPEQHRPSRTGLKLDLSKIPQHTFRHATPKRESPKSESPRANSTVSIGSPRTDIPVIEGNSDKMMDCLSKMTHHANITGNKIIIDKPLRAKDVAELKREVTECAKIIENHAESQCEQNDLDKTIDSDEPIADGRSKESAMDLFKETNDIKAAKESLEDCTSEIFSPEEPESFDSWSICSADLNHNRGDLHSPTSPSYSLFMRGDSSESVIDRIRRRSFYSRFNDRKRPSLTAPPPGISSVTLPRRFSFNSSRERERSRLYNYGIPRTRSDKSYGLYNDEVSCRKSPVDRDRYSEAFNTSSYGHHSPEARSIYDNYGNNLPSTSHDSLRRYVRSPTLDLIISRAKYHSSDIIADNELSGSYKSPLSRSILNESMTDSHCGSRSTSATLPRRFGSTVGNLEPKSVEYYEEILSPSNPDYLSSRDACRSPLLDGYGSRCENGYHHNSNLDLPQFDKQRYADKMTNMELGETNGRLGEQKRNIMRRSSETRDTSSTAADILSNLSVTEQD